MCHLSFFLWECQQHILCVKGSVYLTHHLPRVLLQISNKFWQIFCKCVWWHTSVYVSSVDHKAWAVYNILTVGYSIRNWLNVGICMRLTLTQWFCVWISDKASEWRYTFPDLGWDSRWDQTTWHHPKTETVAHEWGRHLCYLNYKSTIQTTVILNKSKLFFLPKLLKYVCFTDDE